MRTINSDVVIPEIFTEAVQGAFARKDAFFGSELAQAGIIIVNDTLTVQGRGNIGKYVDVPYFGSLGEWVDNNNDGDAVTPDKIAMTYEQAIVKRKSKAFEVTQWAQWGAAGDPYQAAAGDLLTGATRAMDTGCIDAAVSSSVISRDVYSVSTPVKLDNDLITDTISLYWGDEGDNDETAVLVHSRTQADLVKQKDSNGNPLAGVQFDPVTGRLRYFGRRVVSSDKCPLTGSSMPVMTPVSGDNAPGLAGTPTGPWKLVIDLVGAGGRGVGTFRFSTDGGSRWSATYTIPADGVFTLTDRPSANTPVSGDNADSLVGNNGETGITATFADHSYDATDNFTSNATLKVTSLLVKPRAMVFWYNRQALGLQTDKDIMRDSDLGASHLYYVAHPYRRRPGSTKSGIIRLQHNVTPLS